MKKSGLMKKAIVLGLTVAMALGTMTTGSAAGKTWKFSFNNKNFDETVAVGWTQCLDAYDAAKGYGFDEAIGWGAGITEKTASASEALNGAMIGVETDGADAATLNAVHAGVSAAKGDTEVNFYVDLPAGTYDITVYAGGISQNNTYDFNHIYIDGVEVVRDYQTDPWNSETKSSRSKLLTLDNLKWTRTITLTEAKKVEIKASNPSLTNVKYYGSEVASAGGRAYMNGVVIEEVTSSASASTDKVVPKTGVVSVAAICGAVALAGAGVAVVTRKKED